MLRKKIGVGYWNQVENGMVEKKFEFIIKQKTDSNFVTCKENWRSVKGYATAKITVITLIQFTQELMHEESAKFYDFRRETEPLQWLSIMITKKLQAWQMVGALVVTTKHGSECFWGS